MRPREYHLSRYASIRAAVSSGVQHGGGRRREEVAGGGAVEGRGRGTAEGGLESVGEEGEAMERGAG